MSTRISEALRHLGDTVEAIESEGASITDVDAPDDGVIADDVVGLRLRASLPLLPEGAAEGVELTIDGSTVDDDGDLVVDLVASWDLAEGGPSAPTGDPDAAEAGEDDDTSGDEGVRGRVRGDDTSASAGEPHDDDQVPAYRDPERLRAVYDDYDTFPEMTEALGVDVTPQTVRRHMIDLGIHETSDRTTTDPSGDGEADRAPAAETASDPAADPSGEDDDAEEDAVVADGSGEPPVRVLADLDGVTTEELTEVVRTSKTIREVGQRLGLPRARAFRLLNDLDLVDLVSGRLETADRRVSAEELEERIQRVTAAGE